MQLRTLQKKFRQIARQIGSADAMRLTPDGFGTPYAERRDDLYFFVVEERGVEFERRQTHDPDELLYWFVESTTAQIAQKWELKNRVQGQDSRRLWFQKHLEILQFIKKEWAERQSREQQQVLSEHPFDDAIGQ